MSEHKKVYKDLPDMLAAVQVMTSFQTIHNIIRPDYLELLRLTEESKGNEKTFDSLYRACLTRFFTLIEADIYGLNKLDMYNGYDDKKDRFIENSKRHLSRLQNLGIRRKYRKNILTQSFKD